MQLAVIGAGNIGGTIGRAWLAAGHQVRFGVPSPDKYAALGSAGAEVRPVSDAAAGADAVLLAVPGRAVPDVLPSMAPALVGTVLIDATNQVSDEGPLNARASVAEAAATAIYYRAFNTLGWENLANPTFAGGERADQFYAGPDGSSRELLELLIADVGLRPVWVGDIDQIETVDGIARLWFALVRGRHQPRHTAFRMIAD
jgi:predicted dinucleotide-binding enzyme